MTQEQTQEQTQKQTQGQTQEPYVVVIGGANMDIAGRPDGALVAHDSNVGTVRLSHGGVGRNIAHNLALLGTRVKLVTAFGEDPQAAALIAGCRTVGIDVSQALTVPGGATSTYLFVMDAQGEMQVAINDMAILENLTRERLEERLDILRGASVCFVDANLTPDAIAWVCKNVDVPLFCDPISVAKCRKVAPVLSHLHTLKPNRIEAEELSGVTIRGDADLAEAAKRLLDTGLERVFISLGSAGVYAADHSQACRLPLIPAKTVNTTGAGDAMAAALAWGYVHGLPLEKSARAGLAAASIAVESAQTVNPALSMAALQKRMA